MQVVRLAAIAALFIPLSASAQTTEYSRFPTAAPSAFGVTGDALPDGRLIVWNGDVVFVQAGVNEDAFNPAAEGYAGDPGFVAVSPDGTTAILGAGFAGELYRLNLGTLPDFEPSSVIDTVPHFDGIMLTNELVLLDAGRSDFSGADLLVASISAKSTMQWVPVVTKPAAEKADVVLEKPPFAFSSSLAINRDTGTVYVMDGNTRELRSFAASDLVAAFNGGTTLDWSTDGTPVGSAGDFYSGGVAGVRPDGTLIVGGSESFGGPTAVQLIDPDTAAIVETLTPNGTSGFYSVIYNPVTDDLTIQNIGQTFSTGELTVPNDVAFPLPSAGTPVAALPGVLVAGGLLALAGLRGSRE